MLRLHFYAGILIAPFILLAAISGGLYAVAPTIEEFVNADVLSVDYSGPAVPVSQQIEAAKQVRPDLTVTAVWPAPEPGDTTRVLFEDPSLGESGQLAVFIDPSTARPLGESEVYGSSGALPLRAWISKLHANLHLGEPGRIYSELAASWMWVIALGGIYLWADRYVRARRRDSGQARLWTVNRNATGRQRTLGWHGVVGVWIGAFLIFLSATGLTWSTYAGENVTALRSALSWQTPTLSKNLTGAPSAPEVGHNDHGGHGDAAQPAPDSVQSIDSVLEIARANGVTGTVEAGIPASIDSPYIVKEIRAPWVFDTDSIAIDGATGEVTDVLRFADFPLVAKLTSWGIGLHMGLLLGPANQLVLAALMVALTTVIVRGYLMWWRRRPTRGSQWAVGRTPPRGGARKMSVPALIAMAAVTLAVGWFVPLLGISLVAFVLVDVALGFYKRRLAG